MSKAENELDFTLELTSDDLSSDVEYELFRTAETRLRALAEGHSDMRGAAIAMRRPDGGPGAVWHTASVVVYVRPRQIAADAQAEQPHAALDDALNAIERQVREKRARLRDRR